MIVTFHTCVDSIRTIRSCSTIRTVRKPTGTPALETDIGLARSLADVHASLERAADVLGTVKGSPTRRGKRT
jgi:hypothetical protein